MRAFFGIVGGLLACALLLRLLGLANAEPVPPEPTPAATLDAIATGALKLDLTPLWDNLPPSWKADAEGLVTKLQASANPELWQLGFALIERTADLAATPTAEARGIDKSQRLAKLLGFEGDSPEAAPRAIQHGRARLAATLRTIAESGLEDPVKLVYLDLRELAGGFLPAVEEQLDAIEGHTGEALLSQPWAQALEAAANTCRAAPATQTTFTFEFPAGLDHGRFQETLELTQIEGCWVPDQVAAMLPVRLAALDAGLDDWTATPDSPQAHYTRSLLETYARSLATLEATKQDPVRFDAALDTLLGEVTALVIGHRLRTLFE